MEVLGFWIGGFVGFLGVVNFLRGNKILFFGWWEC